LLHPNFDARLGNLDFSYDSSYGTIRSAWSVAGKKATWKLRIPPNATGRLQLSPEELKMYQLDGKPLGNTDKIHWTGSTRGTFEVPAGSYQFEVALP
jgi:alpha-L-rhamnosidase